MILHVPGSTSPGSPAACAPRLAMWCSWMLACTVTPSCPATPARWGAVWAVLYIKGWHSKHRIQLYVIMIVVSRLFLCLPWAGDGAEDIWEVHTGAPGLPGALRRDADEPRGVHADVPQWDVSEGEGKHWMSNEFIIFIGPCKISRYRKRISWRVWKS